MGRHPSPELAAENHFYYLKTCVQNWIKKIRNNLKPMTIPCRMPKMVV